MHAFDVFFSIFIQDFEFLSEEKMIEMERTQKFEND